MWRMISSDERDFIWLKCCRIVDLSCLKKTSASRERSCVVKHTSRRTKFLILLLPAMKNAQVLINLFSLNFLMEIIPSFVVADISSRVVIFVDCLIDCDMVEIN